jgi:D-alanyl-D-alanine carboxypeptidase/D-alanyl-D-alanine-endopeptidase (penicillin-binding protein 4)
VRIAFVKDPTDFARKLLIEALGREGVSVAASLFAEPKAELPALAEYEHLSVVASHRSPKMAELIKVVLKVSHNLYASMLPVLCATSKGKRTLADGLRLEAEVLRQLGVDTGGVSFAGGAGGARADATTPRATVQLLEALAATPEYAALGPALPVLGVDGTLANVVSADSPARGFVRGKTGTLWYDDLLNGRALLRSKALAGTATTAAGTKVVFAAFVNDVPLPQGEKPLREGKALGRLAELLYLHGK